MTAAELLPLGAMLTACTVTDIQRMEVSDRAILAGAVACVGLKLIGFLTTGDIAILTDALWGTAVLGVVSFILFLGGMGFGDVKLLTVMGAFMGLGPSLVTLMLASCLGALYGIVVIRLIRRQSLKSEFPFVPCIAVGCAITVVGIHFLEVSM